MFLYIHSTDTFYCKKKHASEIFASKRKGTERQREIAKKKYVKSLFEKRKEKTVQFSFVMKTSQVLVLDMSFVFSGRQRFSQFELGEKDLFLLFLTNTGPLGVFFVVKKHFKPSVQERQRRREEIIKTTDKQTNCCELL